MVSGARLRIFSQESTTFWAKCSALIVARESLTSGSSKDSICASYRSRRKANVWENDRSFIFGLFICNKSYRNSIYGEHYNNQWHSNNSLSFFLTSDRSTGSYFIPEKLRLGKQLKSISLSRLVISKQTISAYTEILFVRLCLSLEPFWAAATLGAALLPAAAIETGVVIAAFSISSLLIA